MKKVLKWIGLLLLTPIVLFLLAAALLYVPAVQNWAVQRVAAVASERTGMDISVGHVRLKFPLDLSVDDVTVVKRKESLGIADPQEQHANPQEQGDTLAVIGHAVVDVRLRPLFKGLVVVDQLEINDAQVNTLDLISDLQVKGRVGTLSLRSDGIDMKRETVELNDAELSDADLLVVLSDTAAVDTTTSENNWRIAFDQIYIKGTRARVQMPGDSLRFEAYLGNAMASRGNIDLGAPHYQVGRLSIADGTIDMQSRAEGQDGWQSKHFDISELKTTELTMTDSHLSVPHLSLKTPYSQLSAKADVDLNVMDSVAPGTLQLDLDASLGREDLRQVLADALPASWPDWPLSVKTQLSGNLQQATISQFDIDLPTKLHASARGEVSNLMDTDRLLAQLNIETQMQSLDFLPADLLPFNLRPVSIAGDVQANGSRYHADLTARQGQSFAKVKGWYDVQRTSYDAVVSVRQLNLRQFVDNDSLGLLSADITVSGQGTDFMHSSTRLNADATIHSSQYGRFNFNDLQAKAMLDKGHAIASVNSHSNPFKGTLNVDALLSSSPSGVHASTFQKPNTFAITADVHALDLYDFGLVDHPLTVGLCGDIELHTDFKQSHKVSALLGDIYIRDTVETYRPENVGVLLNTNNDTTYLRMQSGDLIVKADATGGYEPLLKKLTALSDTVRQQMHNRTIDQALLKSMLPTMRLYVTSGQENPIANILRASMGTTFQSVDINLTSSATTGLNGKAYVDVLNTGSMRLDTIRLSLKDSDHGLTYQAQVTNNRRNPQFVFNALLDGHLYEHGARTGLRLFDKDGKLGLRLGASAAMEENGLRFHLVPERPTIGYQEFKLNDDNFVFLRNDQRLFAKVDLIADDGTGVKIYSAEMPELTGLPGDSGLSGESGSNSPLTSEPSSFLQDLTVSVNHFDLGHLTAILPYLPHVQGMLDGDFHLMMDQEKQISVATDMAVDYLIYEGSPIGNLGAELVYLQREDDTHAIVGTLLSDEQEIGAINGEYRSEGEGFLSATVDLLRTPLRILNGFIPDNLFGFEGFGEGSIAIKGPLSKPLVDGEVYLDSAYLVSQPYGVRLRFDNDPVRISQSKLLLENFTMYAYNDNPLNIMGDVDFSDLDNMSMNLRMRARDFLLINSKQTAHSVAFGKGYVNFFATLKGPTDHLQMRGRLDVLGTTDLTYMLLDSPLSTDNQLDELVKFTDFTDSIEVVVQRPEPDGLDMNMTIAIDQGAHVKCNLNVDQTNYVDIFGGGDLRMRYNSDGISLTGRYTLTSGEMKYSLPVIPLKTFTIQDGSYVEFTGDPMNPTLNITATERNRATVGQDGGNSRSVAFDCGVVVTKTLNDMGLQFIISAPEDMAVSSELNAMSVEQRGKLAVTMLTTGMYLADGNTSGFSMNSALSSFLQSEINNITGNALKTLDLSIGLDNTTDASGVMHTDYSFNFAKRFWNNRLKVQIGGKVSTGAEVQGQNQSFFDNVTMEYRLSPTSNQYVKLFYNQNAYDWLEGYTGEYGGGFVWKRKLDHWWEMFRFTQKPTTIPSPRAVNPNRPATTLPSDSNRIVTTTSNPDSIHGNDSTQTHK